MPNILETRTTGPHLKFTYRGFEWGWHRYTSGKFPRGMVLQILLQQGESLFLSVRDTYSCFCFFIELFICLKPSLTLECWHMRIKGISETKIWKYRPRISPRATESAEKQSQDWACCLALSCAVSSAFCWLESSTHSLAAVSVVFGELSISGQLYARVPNRHICHQHSLWERTYKPPT